MVEIIKRYWLELLLTGISSGMMLAVKKVYKDNKAVKLGVQALLRDRIIQAHSGYTEKGYCPIHGRENVAAMYAQYHDLGGNGTVTHLVEEIEELPIYPPDGGGENEQSKNLYA